MTAASDSPSPVGGERLPQVLLALIVLTSLFAATPRAQAGEDPWQWLERMSQAMQELSYTGTFVYLHDGQLETMSIVHSQDEKGQRQRLVSLNGEAREVIRDNETVTCILPGSRSVNVTKARPKGPFPVELSSDLAELRLQYRIELLGEDRVAGMPAQMIAITPLDDMRYGYQLWIERDNHLLVRSDTTNEAGEAVEQVMFTDLQIIDNVSDDTFKPGVNGSGYTWKRADGREPTAPTQGSDWLVRSLPPGFKLTAFNRKTEGPDKDEPVDHLVYSDGLATLSVFIDSGSKQPSLLGESKIGAVNAFGRSYPDYHVTVVGEVPAQTLRLVGDSVARRQ